MKEGLLVGSQRRVQRRAHSRVQTGARIEAPLEANIGSQAGSALERPAIQKRPQGASLMPRYCAPPAFVNGTRPSPAVMPPDITAPTDTTVAAPDVIPPGFMACLLWRALAVVALVMGILGIVIPGLPTVCFVLLSAWSASRGWPAFETWLLEHPRFGPPIRHWRQHRSMPHRAKCLASLTMLLSIVILLLTSAPLLLLYVVSAIMCGVAIWMWCFI